MKIRLRLGVAVMVGAAILWVASWWLEAASGLSIALNPLVRPGQVIGSAGQILGVLLLLLGVALIGVAIAQRRR